MVCDFCSSPGPVWRYPAESFRDQWRGWSFGDWLACDECHSLIEAGDRMGLGERSLTAQGLQVAISFLGREEARKTGLTSSGSSATSCKVARFSA
jgi:hypothetical protein